jgi:ABC-type microcin C transport system duplicated ATPase subunit YejF
VTVARRLSWQFYLIALHEPIRSCDVHSQILQCCQTLEPSTSLIYIFVEGELTLTTIRARAPIG